MRINTPPPPPTASLTQRIYSYYGGNPPHDDPHRRDHDNRSSPPTLLRPLPQCRSPSPQKHSLRRTGPRNKRPHLRPPRPLRPGHLARQTLRRLAQPRQRSHRHSTANVLPGHHEQRRLPLHAGRPSLPHASLRFDRDDRSLPNSLSPSHPWPLSRKALPPPIHARAHSRTQRRHQATRRVLRLEVLSPNRSKGENNTLMKIVIPGGTGQVGHLLARHFHAQGHNVIVFSRTPQPVPWRIVPWDGLTLGPWVAQPEQSDVCINLAGRSVNCRYTPANRRAIFDSRVLSTKILGEAIASLQHPPAIWLN